VNQKKLSRRDFLRHTALAAAGATVAACSPQVVKETVVVEKEVEKEVTKVVEVQTEPTVVRFHGRMGTQGDHFIHFAKLFSDDHFPDVYVKNENFPGADYYNKINTMLAGGTVGDGFWIYLGGGFRRYAATGVYAELDAIVDETNYDLTQFYPEAVEGCKMNGKLYGLPWCLHFGCGNILYYNKPMLDAAGVPYPDETWTYDDLLDAAKELTNPDEGVFGVLHSTSTCAGMIHFPRAWGGDVTNPEGTKTLINSEESIAGLQHLSDLFHVHKVSPLPSQVQVGTYQMFAANKLAMFTSGFWGKTVGDYVAPDVWGAAPSPLGPAGRGHVFYIDINRQCD
jgi:multiple sugar transport system substrate-binding protein